MKKLSLEEFKQIGSECLSMGVSFVWQKRGIKPDELIKTPFGELLQFDALMQSISSVEEIPITKARRAVEDVIALSVQRGVATKEWLCAVLKQSEHWHCSQSWLEKNMKKLAENAGHEKPETALLKWSTEIKTDDQKNVLEKLVALYAMKTHKKEKKEQEKSSSASDSLFGFPGNSVWSFASNSK
jgi:hypothetical protein